MNPCQKSDLLVSRFVDGELPADLETPFREHLDGCRRCQKLVRQERRRSELITRAVDVPADALDELERRVLDAVVAGGAEASEPGRQSRFGAHILALAAMAVLSLVLWAVFADSSGPGDGSTSDGTVVTPVPSSPGAMPDGAVLMIHQTTGSEEILPISNGAPIRLPTLKSRTTLWDSPFADPLRDLPRPTAAGRVDPQLILEVEQETRFVPYVASPPWY